jgi:hypothetical protein
VTPQIMYNIISTCRRTFGCPKPTNDNRKKNSVAWWNTHLTVMRKKVNANRRLFQRTNNNNTLRERRKATYKEAKRSYQREINKVKFNSWKEYCNIAGSVNPWSQVYKMAAGKTKEVNKITTTNRPDGTQTTNLQETINEIIDYLYKEDDGMEKPYHKALGRQSTNPYTQRKTRNSPPEEVKHTIDSFSQNKAPGEGGITGGIYQRVFHMFPITITTMYNQYLWAG